MRMQGIPDPVVTETFADMKEQGWVAPSNEIETIWTAFQLLINIDGCIQYQSLADRMLQPLEERFGTSFVAKCMGMVQASVQEKRAQK